MSTNIYDLYNQVREHPDFLCGVIFTTDDFDFNTALKIAENPKRIEEMMTETGFNAAQELHD